MHIRNIDLNLLVVFSFLMEERSVTRAADRLGMSQSGVSHALARLRDLTGDPLFIREQRNLLPTQRAEKMAPLVAKALYHMTEAVAGSAAFDPSTDITTLNLMMPDMGEVLILPPFLTAIGKKAPNIRVNIKPGFCRGFEKDLTTTQIHAAMELQPATNPDIISKAWFTSDLVAVTSISNALGGDYLSKQSFTQAQHILYRPEGLSEPPLEMLLKSMNINRKFSITVSTMSGLIFGAAQTNGVATIPRILAEKFVSLLPIKIYSLPFISEQSQTYLWWPKSLNDVPNHSWLRSLLLEQGSHLSGINSAR